MLVNICNTDLNIYVNPNVDENKLNAALREIADKIELVFDGAAGGMGAEQRLALKLIGTPEKKWAFDFDNYSSVTPLDQIVKEMYAILKKPEPDLGIDFSSARPGRRM